ncbi:hypothetical protein [Variovorax sp. E3]|uniref:hypothetical protein n=1 Tax=Variovorax sp. E3 TaxID=1914993 RepID=UPI0018DD818B|nr:hypothetical protein [Variovorax sp. E3]
MNEDLDVAKRALDLQARARDCALVQLPGYRAWSERKLLEGTSEALIAHLDATAMWLLPEEVSGVSEDDFEELLTDLRDAVE